MLKEIRYEYCKNENEIRFILGTKFYPLEAILLAASDFTCEFWVLVDGNPFSEVLICIKPKKNEKINEKILILEFINHVIAGIKELM